MFSNFFYRCIKSDVCFAVFFFMCSVVIKTFFRFFPHFFVTIFKSERERESTKTYLFDLECRELTLWQTVETNIEEKIKRSGVRTRFCSTQFQVSLFNANNRITFTASDLLKHVNPFERCNLAGNRTDSSQKRD